MQPTIEAGQTEKLSGHGIVPRRSLAFPGETARGLLKALPFLHLTSWLAPVPLELGRGAGARVELH